MFNPALAVVKNSDAYEIKERFDIDGGAIYKKGISYTKLQLYVSNSFRKYRDEENRPNPNGIRITSYNVCYTKLLRVYLEDGTFVNLKIVEDGYANAYTRYEITKKDEIVSAERRARENKRGLWGNVEGLNYMEEN